MQLLDGRDHRIETCGRHPAPGQEARLVKGEDGSHGFAGLIRCGSVWACPVCRAHIARQRGEEVTEALTNADTLGLYRTFVTFTARHTPDDELDPLWRSVRDAVGTVFSGRAGQRFRKAIGYVGRITANEVTHGATGWHPHLHVVLFSDHPVSETDIWRLWSKAAAKHGLDVHRDGLNVQAIGPGGIHAGDVADYVTKASTASWTLSDEMTDTGSAKAGRGDRHAPFQLLDIVSDTGDADAADAFVEYVKASHGVSSVRWSPNLRDRLAVTTEELTDDEAANTVETDVQDVMTFSPTEWTAIHAGGYRVQLLDAADRDGIQGARRVVQQAVATFYRRRRPSSLVA